MDTQLPLIDRYDAVRRLKQALVFTIRLRFCIATRLTLSFNMETLARWARSEKNGSAVLPRIGVVEYWSMERGEEDDGNRPDPILSVVCG